MAVRIRLQRHGKKGKPFYHIVVADSRSKRDGRFIEKLGTYDPNTNPATITLDVDGSLKWLKNGAQPSDTARSILSYKGVLFKKHLLGGVKKGAFDKDEAEKRFQEWLTEKEGKIQQKRNQIDKAKTDEKTARLSEESKIKEARIAAAAKIERETQEQSGEASEQAKTSESTTTEKVSKTK